MTAQTRRQQTPNGTTLLPTPRRFLRCIACGTLKKERSYALCSECYRVNGTLPTAWFGHWASGLGVLLYLLLAGRHPTAPDGRRKFTWLPDDSLEDSGAAYVFTRTGTTWSQQAYLKASNTGAGDVFGFDVAVDGDIVAGLASEGIRPCPEHIVQDMHTEEAAEQDPSVSHIDDVKDLPVHLVSELRHFFENYKTLENKKVLINDFLPKEDAFAVIRASVSHYNKMIKK